MPSTCWATATLTSLAPRAGRGNDEGSKSDQASLGGNSLLDAWFTPAWQAQHVPSTYGRQCGGHFSWLACPGKVVGPKVTSPVWVEIHVLFVLGFCRLPGRGKNTGLAQLASREDLSV